MARTYMLRVRLSAADLAELDKRRGDRSRSEFVRAVICSSQSITFEPDPTPKRRPLAAEPARKPMWKKGRKVK